LVLAAAVIVIGGIEANQYCQSLIEKGEHPEGCGMHWGIFQTEPFIAALIVVAVPFLVQGYRVYSRSG